MFRKSIVYVVVLTDGEMWEGLLESYSDSLSIFALSMRWNKKVLREYFLISNLVDPASSDMLVSKIKPCMCK